MMPIAIQRGFGCGRAGAWDALHGRAAESAQADSAISSDEFIRPWRRAPRYPTDARSAPFAPPLV